MKTLGNIIWVVFGKMHFRLAKLALSPFGKELSLILTLYKLHKLLHGLANIHVFGIEPYNRHRQGRFTQRNSTKPILTMDNAVNKYGYPATCAY